MSSDQMIAFGFVFPKFVLLMPPHSPFAAKLPRLQSGTKLPFASPHDRVVEFTDVLIGFRICDTSTLVFATYRPIDALSAVRPVPKRSYDTPRRGLMSFQFGMSVTL